MTNKNAHHLPAWAEIEYTALCKSPYLSTPFFVPKESKVFLCREDGSRKEARILYLVFKPADAPEDAEWEDDPVPGEILVSVLGDDVEGDGSIILLHHLDEVLYILVEEDSLDWLHLLVIIAQDRH